MKAVRLHGREDLRIEDVPAPAAPGPGQIRLRNGFVGICGSDLHLHAHPEASPVDVLTPHPVTGAHLPQTLGHEFSGTVAEVGPGVDGIAVGDRGAVFPVAYSCGECVACRHGEPTSCRLMASLGANASGGGMSESVTISASQFHPVPASVSLQQAALVEPMAVAWHGVGRSRATAEDTALILGAGPIGIGTWYALRAHGVADVLISEPNPDRRARVAALGATVIDPLTEDVSAAVAELTDGDGVTIAYDAAGVPAALESALAALAPGGRVVLQSPHEAGFEIQPSAIMMGEYELIGSVGYTPAEFDCVIARMAAGDYDTTGWVEEMELDDAPAAIERLTEGAGTKILLRVR